ncbi:MAG: hypothetical protein H6576_05920 [Lewinellaceae bacterium]|nr:hypothetical protein [Bacteroidota bacterium]MCB9343211.1 hypothetical protein [Lewinellaceae bacterium]
MSENLDNKTPKENKPKPGTESNPIGDAFDIMVSIPDRLEIKMVNASILSDYEVWIFISSLISNAVIGFWVAYATNTNVNASSILFWNSIVFTILFMITLIVALSKRYTLSKKSKSIKLKTSKVESDNNE